VLSRRRLLRRRRLRVHASPPQAAAPAHHQRAHRASKNRRRPGRGHYGRRPAAASPARAPRSAKHRGGDAGATKQEAAGAVARHGVRVRARAGGHGHGRDQEAPEGAAAGSGRRRRERAAVLLRRGVGAVEAHTVAELQGRRGRGGCRGAGQAGVGRYVQSDEPTERGGWQVLLIDRGWCGGP